MNFAFLQKSWPFPNVATAPFRGWKGIAGDYLQVMPCHPRKKILVSLFHPSTMYERSSAETLEGCAATIPFGSSTSSGALRRVTSKVLLRRAEYGGILPRVSPSTGLTASLPNNVLTSRQDLISYIVTI